MYSSSSPNKGEDNNLLEKLFPFKTITEHIGTIPGYYTGFSKYMNDFVEPYLTAVNYFMERERNRLPGTMPLDAFKSYAELMQFNMDIGTKFFFGSMKAIQNYMNAEMNEAISAFFNMALDPEGIDFKAFIEGKSQNISAVASEYPQAIENIASEFGFQFENGKHLKVAETERFILYQVLPSEKDIRIRETGKPVLIIPPFVLGANILSFLPGEKKSYAHGFADQGIPTYIRVSKDIETTPAVQIMTPEDDALDSRYFCRKIRKRHEKPITLNGYCQGGYTSLINILSGKLDNLADALITCVAPMDGTRSRKLGGFLQELPKIFNNLDYGTKTLPNGNKVADGKLMGWIYKLVSIENETPVANFLRDMMMLKPREGKEMKISKTAAAINYWLQNERTDLPLAITDLSFNSYNIPITENGTLPVTLFGRKLNLKGIKEKEIKWLLCYGKKDDLVEPEVALAPLDYIDVEISPFPKGHVAIATSWSNPKSRLNLNSRFGENHQYRGPVRFQLDLDDEFMEEPVDLEKSYLEN